MYASNSHSCTHLVLALGIVREPTVWGSLLHQASEIHAIGRGTDRRSVSPAVTGGDGVRDVPVTRPQLPVRSRCDSTRPDDTTWPLFKLKCLDPGMAGKYGDVAWRWRISRCFYPRNLVLKTGYIELQFYS